MSFSASTINSAVGASELAALLANVRLSRFPFLIVGAGVMGSSYAKALDALGAKDVRVARASTGGYESIVEKAGPEAHAIVAVPIAALAPCVKHLLKLGYKKILCEKPVSLRSREIEELDEIARRAGADVRTAFNRVSYPSVVEARKRIAVDGGATSAFYTFTEAVGPSGPNTYTSDVQRRWGVANSLHVMSLAHSLVGFPREWNATRSGALAWHPTGSVFVGAGTTDASVPFSFHADWRSAGRWSAEIFTNGGAYRFCPLEKLQTKTTPLSDWRDVPAVAFAPNVKAGLAEQVAALADASLRSVVPLVTLTETARLVKFGEDIFGYEDSK